MNKNLAFIEACKIVGKNSDMAKFLGVSAPTVTQWINGVRRVPAERCPDVERATGGLVTCEELRPDLAEQWAYLRGTARKKFNSTTCATGAI